MNIDAKILMKILVNCLKKYIRKIKHCLVNTIVWMESWFNIPKSINAILHLIRIKNENHINLIDVEKAFDKIQYPSMLKMMPKLGIK